VKRYKLLKDLPTFKAGQLAYISEQGNLIAGNPDKPEITDARTKLMMYHRTTLDKFPEILTEWFEEIQEPTDSIHWEPLSGDIYWYSSNTGVVLKKQWMSYPDDIRRHRIGNTYRTEKECEKACDRELAEVRLRRTSTFKPDFENGKGGWIVFYDHECKTLAVFKIGCYDSGEPVHYASREEAEKSIKENREDWLIYFGIEEGE
jgi:hypothetical protein